ncbi:NAD-dependent epimerase/dehydratase family protein [Rufibacter psychrotolerans]|uniref:NAD-dependent epimerase/dehydratase family protein n=1 Tax=Rufibacter psychrotolerans TaxID=2812556 RepID=UPI0019686C66|nr:NAD(P)-dependent oxidoreductase [Rufibacter sp. SYSU D00308]
MYSCVIFGGAGYVGQHLAQMLLSSNRFSAVHIADLNTKLTFTHPSLTVSRTDVQEPIPLDLTDKTPDWIFNLAAIHREPGHLPQEYYATNIKGAQNICAYATAVGCQNLFFTSSIAVYGPTIKPTDEDAALDATTPYGLSKKAAEELQLQWQAAVPGRRLIITRPGVIYGPGDPGNIMRMIKAIRNGYFVFPGSKKIRKSYAYIYGFLDSITFMMEQKDPVLIYNYVETPTESIGQIAQIIKEHYKLTSPILALPSGVLVPVSRVLQALLRDKNPVHPVRVKKAATPTHIIPKKLMSMGFRFQYDFRSSIEHWTMNSPGDFS